MFNTIDIFITKFTNVILLPLKNTLSNSIIYLTFFVVIIMLELLIVKCNFITRNGFFSELKFSFFLLEISFISNNFFMSDS